MLYGLVLPHESVESVAIVADHYEVSPLWRLPPVIAILTSEELSWQGDRDRLASSWSLYT